MAFTGLPHFRIWKVAPGCFYDLRDVVAGHCKPKIDRSYAVRRDRYHVHVPDLDRTAPHNAPFILVLPNSMLDLRYLLVIDAQRSFLAPLYPAQVKIGCLL